MKLLSRVVTTVSREVDLKNLPIKDWPDDARQLAVDVIKVGRNQKALAAQLPGLRISWLLAKMEELQDLYAEFDNPRDLLN